MAQMSFHFRWSKIIRQYSYIPRGTDCIEKKLGSVRKEAPPFQFHVSQQSNVSYGHKTESSAVSPRASTKE